MYDLLLALINTVIDAGLATAKDTDIFKDYTPETEDTCITLREYAGTPGSWYCEVGVRSIQVEVRSKSNKTAFEKIWALYQLFKPTEAISSIGNEPCMISMRNSPVKLGIDSNQRTQYVFNMGITTKYF